MKYLVHYRTAQGARAEIEMDAPNQAVVIATMRTRGATVMNISEVIAKKAPPRPSRARRFAKIFAIFIFTLVIVASLVTIFANFYFADDDEKELKLKIRDVLQPNSAIRIEYVK